MSTGVLLFQGLVFIVIVFSGFGGRLILIKVTATIAAFSLTTVFMPWLMAVQFTTIAIAFLIAYQFAKPSGNNSTAVSERKAGRK